MLPWVPLVLALVPGATPLPSGPPIPVPIIDLCRCSGTAFERAADGSLSSGIIVTDVAADPSVPPPDTCASGAVLEIKWHAEPKAVVGWEYRLEPGQSQFVSVGPRVTAVTYHLDPTYPGSLSATRTFTLRAIGPQSVRETQRRFSVNYGPDTWLAGPDPNSASLSVKPNGERYALLVGGRLVAPIQGSFLGPDSVAFLPALRAERRTFFEIWEDTVFVRTDGDTVHMNSWVVLHNGGFDRDSPYSVHVTELARQLPGFPGGPVLEPGPANGSPVGFRSQLIFALWPSNRLAFTATSGIYPLFDPADVFHQPRIAAYYPMIYSGRVYLSAFATDGDGAQDRRFVSPGPGSPNAVTLVEKVENGTATPYEQGLRRKVLAFYVDRAPWFVTQSPLFRPRPLEVFTTSQWSLKLVAYDSDPHVILDPPGGPSSWVTLRRRIEVRGRDLQGNELIWIDPLARFQDDVLLTVPASLAPGPCTIDVELCDCDLCEDFPGSGRCVTQSFAVIYQPSAPPGAEPSVTQAATTGPTLLFAPYPNPSRLGASVRFRLAVQGKVEIELFDLAGHRVRRLRSGALPAGEHAADWDGADEGGRRAPAGLYLVRLRSAQVESIRKLLVMP